MFRGGPRGDELRTPALSDFVWLMRENCLPLEVKDTERPTARIERALGVSERRRHISAEEVATMRRLLGERRRIHADPVVERAGR